MSGQFQTVQKKYKICFLGYSFLTELAREVIAALPPSDVEYILMDCSLEAQEECVEEARHMGCEVFIAGPGNTAKFLNQYNYPIVTIPIQTIDYAYAIRTAIEEGCKEIALARHRFSPPIAIELLEQIMTISLDEITFESSNELNELISASKYDAVIGTSLAVDIANTYGKKGILLYHGKSSIQEACFRAAELVKEIHNTRLNQEITKTILNNSQFGIIVTDPKGHVQMANRTAQKYTGISQAQMKNQLLTDFFPNLSTIPLLKDNQLILDSYRLIQGAMMRCTQERILLNHQTIGVLTTIYPEAHNRKKANSTENIYQHRIYHWEDLIINSAIMKKLVETGKKFSESNYPIIIIGEAASGREAIARCIHSFSKRVDKPCITLDLSTLDSDDAAHILLGYERKESTINGILADTNGGSIIIKNISLAKPNVLACLMQALNTQQIFRPGMEAPIVLDLVCYTTVTKDEYISMSPELRSILSICQLTVPSLSKRKEDICLLFTKYLSQIIDMPKYMKYTKLNDQMKELLEFYSWPGNLRELEMAATRYFLSLKAVEKPSAQTQYLMLLQAIGEEFILKEITKLHPALVQRPIEDKQAFLDGILMLKKYMKYSNETISDKLSVSRTTIWRILKSIPETPV